MGLFAMPNLEKARTDEKENVRAAIKNLELFLSNHNEDYNCDYLLHFADICIKNALEIIEQKNK